MRDANSLSEQLKTSRLDEVLADVLSQVKAKPDNLMLRNTLFRLYCIEGEWEKALMQLQTIALLDDAAQKQCELYKNLVFSELIREEVLTGARSPGLLEENFPEWMSLTQQANRAHMQNEHQRAETLRQKAFQLAPESAGGGRITGDFAWIADSDGRIGPACEFISAGGYRQVPFASLQLLHVKRPGDLLDLVWAPAHIQAGGQFYYGYVPSRYPLSANAAQSEKLGWRSEWQEVSASLSTGAGRKVLITDSGEFSLLEITEISFA